MKKRFAKNHRDVWIGTGIVGVPLALGGKN
jgi:hypothetical protein